MISDVWPWSQSIVVEHIFRLCTAWHLKSRRAEFTAVLRNYLPTVHVHNVFDSNNVFSSFSVVRTASRLTKHDRWHGTAFTAKVVLPSVFMQLWDSTPTNKLFSIKPVLGKNKPRTSLCRRDERVFTRLRISHSRMTHSYLLSRENQPIRDHCKCVFSVKYMLLECPSTAVIRHKYFSSTTLKELFSNVDARCILDFTKESGFYHAI